MNKKSNKIKIAFTLAEMMVVLALFSVISAATLPVITARQQLPSGASGLFEGGWQDSWALNNEILSYHSIGMSLNTGAVMIGSDIEDDALTLGYPSLIVSDIAGKDDDVHNSSQIIFLKRNGANTYYAGRIATPKESPNSFAIGANALMFDDVNENREHNVAIGSNAMNFLGKSPTSNIRHNVAIGKNALIGSSKIALNSVAIGAESGSGFKEVENSVAIGHRAASTMRNINNSYLDNSVYIGSYSGYIANATAHNVDNVAIGAYSSFNVSGTSNTSLGYYAGASVENETMMYDTVNIGTYAGVLNDSSGAIISSIAIGKYASYLPMDYSISIGEYAGAEPTSFPEYDVGENIVIGTRAGYKAASRTISIGTYAGSHSTSTATDAFPIYIGTYAGYGAAGNPSVAIGYYAAYKTTGTMTDSIMIGQYSGFTAKNLDHTVCIGYKSCYSNASGKYDVRITRMGTLRPSGATTTRTITSKKSHIGDIPTTLYYSSNDTSVGFGSYSGNLWDTSYSTLFMSPLYASQAYSTTDSSIIMYGDVFSYKTTLQAASDRRLKENIRPAKYGLKDVRKINVYNFTWKNDETNTPQIGIIAQEMQKIIPESVKKGTDGYLTINTTWYIYTMVNAIKEVNKQVENIQTNIFAYKKEFTTLLGKVNKLEKEINHLEKENRELTRQIDVAYKKAQSRK